MNNFNMFSGGPKIIVKNCKMKENLWAETEGLHSWEQVSFIVSSPPFPGHYPPSPVNLSPAHWIPMTSWASLWHERLPQVTPYKAHHLIPEETLSPFV